MHRSSPLSQDEDESSRLWAPRAGGPAALALGCAWGKLPLLVVPSGPFVTQSRGIRGAPRRAGGLLRSKALAVEVRGGVVHPSGWRFRKRPCGESSRNTGRAAPGEAHDSPILCQRDSSTSPGACSRPYREQVPPGESLRRAGRRERRGEAGCSPPRHLAHRRGAGRGRGPAPDRRGCCGCRSRGQAPASLRIWPLLSHVGRRREQPAFGDKEAFTLLSGSQLPTFMPF